MQNYWRHPDKFIIFDVPIYDPPVHIYHDPLASQSNIESILNASNMFWESIHVACVNVLNKHEQHKERCFDFWYH
jgi:hypothetical protein